MSESQVQKYATIEKSHFRSNNLGCVQVVEPCARFNLAQLCEGYANPAYMCVKDLEKTYDCGP